jgi:hypothetical protein
MDSPTSAGFFMCEKTKRAPRWALFRFCSGSFYFDGAKMPVWLPVISTESVAMKACPHQFDLPLPP